MKFFFLLLAVISGANLSAQQIQLLISNNNTSIRGLSVVNDQIIWVSGTNGTVGKSTNAGKTWQWMTVKNFEKNDFRDIEAFDEKTAIIMAIAEPAFILKTNDGGNTWKIVFSDSTKGMFLDAMDFSDEQHGVVVGDPINHKIFLAFTNNQGDNWNLLNYNFQLEDGESLFASSGTNIKLLNKERANTNFRFITGGKKARLFGENPPSELNVVHGETSQGANSIAVNIKSGRGIIVGGDFAQDKISKGNCVLFSLNGKRNFSQPVKGPSGYKSCVEYITENKLICCGTSGVDISVNGGRGWQHISNESFHVCKKAKNGNFVFLAGINGKIARLKW